MPNLPTINSAQNELEKRRGFRERAENWFCTCSRHGQSWQARYLMPKPWHVNSHFFVDVNGEASSSKHPHRPPSSLHDAAATIDPVAEEACASCAPQWLPGLYCLCPTAGGGGAHHRLVPPLPTVFEYMLTCFADGKKISIEGTRPQRPRSQLHDPKLTRDSSRIRPHPSMRESRRHRPQILLPRKAHDCRKLSYVPCRGGAGSETRGVLRMAGTAWDGSQDGLATSTQGTRGCHGVPACQSPSGLPYL